MQELREPHIVIAGAQAGTIDRRDLKLVRGSFFSKIDHRFFIIAILSALIHLTMIYYLQSIKLQPVKPQQLEQMSERFAKLIVEKPLPKIEKVAKDKKPLVDNSETVQSNNNVQLEESNTASTTAPKISDKERAVAKKSVAAKIARAESKVRTVGVLGMLTGSGSTARGPAVVDVLGSLGAKKEHTQDLEQALKNMSGLQKTADIEVAEKKLVKSRDLGVERGEKIDELIAGIGAVKTTELSKRGDIVVQRPESIEGAASSNTKRDNDAINKVVLERKASIRMTYEKYLKRDPTLSGKITIRFTIKASGDVGDIVVLENTTGSKDLEDEISRKVAMWTFESIPDGDVTVTYPFVFRPS